MLGTFQIPPLKIFCREIALISLGLSSSDTALFTYLFSQKQIKQNSKTTLCAVSVLGAEGPGQSLGLSCGSPCGAIR